MNRTGPSLTLKELATLTQSTLVGDPDHLIFGVEDLEMATSQDASFLDNPRYEVLLNTTNAGVIFLHPKAALHAGKNYLITETPSLAFQKVIEFFIPEIISGFPGIHSSAVIHPSVTMGENVVIGPNAVIDRGAKIGKNTVIGPSVTIGAEVVIGENCHIYANCVIRERCVLGNRVFLQPGAVIGSCGFGYFTTKEGRHLPLKQLGRVVLEDDVEIGANTTIDRARFKETRIGRGTKIDNLVQIAHQVSLGKECLIVSQVGIAGSTEVGNHVVMGGQVGVVGHLSITDQVILAARSAVTKSIVKPGVYSGAPASPIRECNEQLVYTRQLKSLFKRIRELEKKLSMEDQESDSLQ